MDARSQTSCPKPPPYELLRQDENYSYLSNPSCSTDFWDPIKYMPLNSKGDRYLRSAEKFGNGTRDSRTRIGAKGLRMETVICSNAFRYTATGIWASGSVLSGN